MKQPDFIREATLGGPGLDGYAYQADIYCPGCGEDIIIGLAKELAPTLSGTDDPSFSDSDTLPQPIFFGESESPEHCAECGEYLYGEEEKEEDHDEEDT